MPASLDDRIDSEMAQSLRLRLWAVLATMNGPLDSLEPHLDGHLRFIRDGVAAGQVVFAGPLIESGRNVGNGLLIIRGGSEDEIRETLKGDPFYAEGIRNYQVNEWQVNVGRLSVSVDIGSGRGSVS